MMMIALIARSSPVFGAADRTPSIPDSGLRQVLSTPTAEVTSTPNSLGWTEAEIKAGQPTGIIFGAILLVAIIFISVLLRVKFFKTK